MSIEVKSVTKLFGQQKALNNVSFNVNPGEITGFLGPNGAGKSTMMKILTCFLPQTEGNAKVCGFDVEIDPIDVRRCIGYLPEHNPLYLDMYVKEFLAFAGGVHKINKIPQRVDEMIEITGLQKEKNKKIGALSKGYRQRVGLAQSLIHDPKVLILDEPTTGLDPNQITEIRELIKRVGREKTVLFSTHIMQEVQAVCDRVVIISLGEIVANDLTANIGSGLVNQQVIIVEFDKAVDRAVVKKVKGVKSAELIGANTWKITSNSEEDIRPLIFSFALSQNASVLTLKKEEQNLESIFRKLTSKQ